MQAVDMELLTSTEGKRRRYLSRNETFKKGAGIQNLLRELGGKKTPFIWTEHGYREARYKI
jgi:hypothetical protein